MLKVAIIGAGYMGSLHAQVYAQRKDVQVVAVVDTRLERAAQLGQSSGADYYQDAETMLRYHRPDAASIAVTGDHLATTTALLLENDIPTLIEKPMATTYADGEKLAELALRRNVVTAVGYTECFNPAAEAMRTLIADNAIGQVYEIDVIRRSPPPNRELNMSVIYDLLGHDLCLLNFLLPDSPIMGLQSTSVRTDKGFVDGYCGIFTLKNGIVGSLNTNRYSPDKVRQWVVIGAQGSLHCDLLHRRIDLHRAGEPIKPYPVANTDALVSEIDDFVSAIRNGHLPRISARRGAELLRMLDAAAAG